MPNKDTTPLSLYGNDKEYLREQEKTNELLAEIAGEEYESPGDIPNGKYVIQKRLLDAAQKKNELLDVIAEEGGGGGRAAKGLNIDYATDVISLKNKNGDIITGSGATLPAYGVSFDPTTGGLTLTKNGTAVSGQTVTIPNYGSPVGVTDASDMTDEGVIYLYEGETDADYTNGHFYYYDGTAWADGGEYAAATVQTDKTLLVEDRAADAKATGDAIDEVKAQFNHVVDNIFNGVYATANAIYINTTTHKFATTSSVNLVIIPISPNTQYTVWKKTATIMRVATGTIETPASGDSFNSLAYHSSASSDPLTITSGESDAYMYIQLYANSDSDDLKSVEANISTLMVYKMDLHERFDAVDNAIDDVNAKIMYIGENGAYQVTGIAFESGRVNDSGEEVDNENYSRTVEYISTSNINYLISSGTGFSIRYFNYINDSFVYQASKYVNSGNTQVLNAAYEYFRIDIGVEIANHPEKKCLFYKYTADRKEINAIKNREIGKYKSPIYGASGVVPTWKLEYINNTYITTLTLDASYVIFEGYPEPANRINVNDIKDAASASEYTTVSGNDISGSNYAIVYNISDGAISIVQASAYKHNDSDEIVLFAANLNSFVSGALVDYAIRYTYRKNTKTLSDIKESIDQNLVLPDYWREYMVSKIGDVQAKDLLVGNHGDSFIFCTDQHYNSNDGNSPAIINYIRTHSSVSALVMGGDLIHGKTSGKQDAINDLINARNKYITFSPKYLRGNHDNNTEIKDPSPEKAISDSELYAIIMKPVENEVVANGNLYYYFENNAQKIRYICMDTGEPGSKVFSQPDPQTGNDTDPQIIWMKARITELESGWTAVILSHKFFKIQNGAMVPDGNGTAIMHGLNSIYDSANATIACVIAGHSHRDYAEVSSKGYPIIAVTCDERAGEQSGGTRTENTYTEQAMDVFHIDTQNRGIYATRIGFGTDRTFSY